MEIETEILNFLGIGKEGIGLIKQIKKVEKLDENISSVTFIKPGEIWREFSVYIRLKNGFKSFEEFKQYAKRRGLKGELTLGIEYDYKETYLIFKEGVVGKFY
jgi:hypothetical protein